MSAIPISDAVKPRPVLLRQIRRIELLPLLPPTEAAKSDAIAILREGDETHPLWLEACRIWHEASVPHQPM